MSEPACNNECADGADLHPEELAGSGWSLAGRRLLYIHIWTAGRAALVYAISSLGSPVTVCSNEWITEEFGQR
ncbi:hypothetical protein GDO78_008078 [Eleutherodactylus coqui]|uniref:Uncharacterized protein n=1 Tax=Eleutherodactylus coqui TaxID=57060 RepID=A0A8J6KAP1_ELECQ|nr:hypothetical protein GDO78_008078 [Eleutherodactylus coqui]